MCSKLTLHFLVPGKKVQSDTAALLATALHEDSQADEDLRVAVQNGQSLQNTDALQSLLATAALVHYLSLRPIYTGTFLKITSHRNAMRFHENRNSSNYVVSHAYLHK